MWDDEGQNNLFTFLALYFSQSDMEDVEIMLLVPVTWSSHIIFCRLGGVMNTFSPFPRHASRSSLLRFLLAGHVFWGAHSTCMVEKCRGYWSQCIFLPWTEYLLWRKVFPGTTLSNTTSRPEISNRRNRQGLPNLLHASELNKRPNHSGANENGQKHADAVNLSGSSFQYATFA